MPANFYFRGTIQPYLQGYKALDVFQQTPGCLVSYLGSKRTRIRLRDFRSKVRYAAEQSLSGKNPEAFSDAFDRPARVKIRFINGKAQIDLHDVDAEKSAPMLWMGVLKDGETIPLASVDWELFRSVGKARTGFVMLLTQGITEEPA